MQNCFMRLRQNFPTSLAKLLTWGCLAFLACMALLLAGVIQWSRADHIDKAEATAAALSRLAASEVARRVDLADVMLTRMVAIGDALRWDDAASVETAHRELQALAVQLPNVADLRLLDPDGFVRVSALRGQPEGIGYADRDYFAAQRASDHGLLLSRLLKSRFDGQLVFVLSRRLTGSKGEFLGVAAVVIHAATLSHSLGTMAVPYRFVVSVFGGKEGELLARHPFLTEPEMLTARMSATEQRELASAQDGMAADAAGGPNPQLRAWTSLLAVPIMVTVDVPMEDVLSSWRRNIFPSLLFGFTALGGVSLLGAVAIRRARAEHKVQRRLLRAGEVLENMLAEKDALLAEVHHRVKNNMQVIVNLLQMEASRLTDLDAQQRLDVVARRVVLIGRVHERSYASDSFARMDMAGQLTEQCRNLADMRPGAQVSVHAEHLSCGLDVALPLSLIAHELVSNALIHAGQPARVAVSLCRQSGRIDLKVSDSGEGPAKAGGQGLGLMLVNVLAGQIGADVTTRTNPGYCVTVTMAEAEFDGAPTMTLPL
jgi:two-component sensor histidine kinase